MSEHENIKLVKLGYETYRQGDIVALLDWLTDDVDWHVPGPSELPFAGSYQGRHEVARFLKIVDETLEFYEFEPREFIAQDNS
ncbi:MAG: nuclear transport factor 2 family protein, partial [Thermodesulfobacteriota bacterium]